MENGVKQVLPDQRYFQKNSPGNKNKGKMIGKLFW
jgi:hypothetical protein